MKNSSLLDFFSSSTEFSAIDHFLQLMVKTNTFDQRLDILQEQLRQSEHLQKQFEQKMSQDKQYYQQEIKKLTQKYHEQLNRNADLESKEKQYRLEIEQLRQKIKQPTENKKIVDATAPQPSKTQTIHSSNELEQGVWTDPKTGLMWARISIGQEWKNNKIVGSPKWIDWRKGSHLCKTLKLAGYNDWRLPTIDELATLMSANGNGYVNENILSQSGSKLGFYWSSSSTQYSSIIQGVDFDKGIIITYNHLQFDGLIRAVRNSKIG